MKWISLLMLHFKELSKDSWLGSATLCTVTVEPFL